MEDTADNGGDGVHGVVNGAGAGAGVAQAESIAVCIRVRPLNDREVRNKDVSVLRTLPGLNAVSLTDRDGAPLSGNNNVFQYDHIFDETASTQHMYQSVAKRIVRSTLDGINGTIFAYGQTSSGKTYTMQGTGGLPYGRVDKMGILQLAVEDIFAYIEQSTDRDFLLRVSYVEIYNEVVKDLLSDREQSLKLREDPRKGVHVECKEEIITNYESIWQLLEQGDSRRTVGQTLMNERSSRSHSIFRIVIESKAKSLSRRQSEDDMTGAVLVACLSLVDLAGSESVRHTQAEGLRQREAGNINKSLLTLSRVINALASNAANGQSAPFRDSKLTRLLQNSLDGNTRTLIICCVTPSDRHVDETKSTLQFAARAKKLQTSARVNEVLDDQAQLKRLKREVHELKKLVNNVSNPEAYNALKAENEALLHEKNKKQAEIDRLAGLILSSANVQKPKRSIKVKRSRETWCPGDFVTEGLASSGSEPLRAWRKNFSFLSPNPQPRKRQIGIGEENIDPQNLLAELENAMGDELEEEDEVNEDEHNESTRKNLARRSVDSCRSTSSVIDEEQQRMLLQQHEDKLLHVIERELQNFVEGKSTTDAQEIRAGVDAERNDRWESLLQQIRHLFLQSQSATKENEGLRLEVEDLQKQLGQLNVSSETAKSVSSPTTVANPPESDELVQQLQKELQETREKLAEEQSRQVQVDPQQMTDAARLREDLALANEKFEKEKQELESALAESAATIKQLHQQLEDAFVEVEETKLVKGEAIAVLEKEMSDLQSSVEEQQKAFKVREAALLRDVELLKTTVEGAVVSVGLDHSADDQAKKLEQEKASLQSEMQERDTMIRNLQLQNEELTSANTNLMEAMVALEEKLQENVSAPLAMDHEAVRDMVRENELLKKNAEMFANSHEELLAEKQQTEEKMRQIQQEVEDNRSELDDVLLQTNALMRDKEELETKIKALSQELDSAQAQLQRVQPCIDQNALEASIHQLREENERLRSQHEEAVSALSSQLNAAHKELAALKVESMGSEAAEESNRAALLSEKVQLESELQALREAMQEVNKRLIAAQSDSSDLRETIQSLETELATSRDESSRLIDENRQMAEKHQQLEDRNGELAAQMDEQLKQISAIESTSSQLKQENDRLTKALSNMQVVDELREELSRLRTEHTVLVEEKQQLCHTKNALEAAQVESAARVEELEMAIKEAQGVKQDLSAKITTLEKQREELLVDSADAESSAIQRAAQLEESLANEQKEHQATQERLKSIMTELEALRQEFESTKDDKAQMDMAVTCMENDLETVQEKHRELLLKISECEQEIQTATASQKLAEERLESTMREWNEGVRLLLKNSQSESSVPLNATTADLITLLSGFIETLEIKQQAARDDVNRLMLEKSATADELDSLKVKLGDATSQIMELTAARDEMQQALATELHGKDQQALNDREAFEHELEEVRHKLQQSEMSCRVLEEEVSRLQENVKVTENSRNELQTELGMLQQINNDEKQRRDSLMQTTISEMEQKLEESQTVRAKLELDVKSYEESVFLMRNELKDSADTIADLLETRKSLEASIQKASSEHECLEKELHRQQSITAMANEEKEELRLQIHQRLLSSEGNEMLLQETIESLQRKLSDANETLAAREAQSKETARLLEQQIRDVQQDLNSLKEENQFLREESQRQQQQQSEQILSLERSYSTLLETKQTLENEFRSSEAKWRTREEAGLNKATAELDSMREQFEEAQKELEQFQRYADEEIHKLRSTIEMNDAEMLELSQSAKKNEELLQKRVAKMQVEFTELYAKHDVLIEEKAQLEASTQSEIEQLRTALRTATHRSNEVEDNVEELKQQYEDARANQLALEAQVKEMKVKMESLESEAYQSRHELEDLTESLKSAENEAMRYHTQLTETQVEKEKLDKVVEAQKKRIDKLEQVKMTTETLDLFRKMKSDRQKLQLEVTKLQEQVRQMESSNSQSAQDEQRAARALERKDAEINTLRRELDSVVKVLKDEKERALKAKAEFQNAQDAARKEHAKDVEALEAELESSAASLRALEANVATLNKEKEDILNRKSGNVSYLEKENLELLVENRKLKKVLESKGRDWRALTTTADNSNVDDDVKCYESSLAAASAVLGAECVSQVTAKKPATATAPSQPQTEPQAAAPKPAVSAPEAPSVAKPSSSSGGFLLQSSEATDQAEEEATPACTQQ
ncbi:TPA: hypothetical protein N0F65_007966 [Lagenidium giganteum]|uniref:Kinesin motor domain-containing protein n=1 Tax=Lagenidium giganteum TaxID=4803 RepID=A0AAV2YFZ7_9STRA|nr:TPA: hypothetical protein N0F65_007966 [Lagenidium giganteum]